MAAYNTDTITPFPALPTNFVDNFEKFRIGLPAHLLQAEPESHVHRRGEHRRPGVSWLGVAACSGSASR